MKLRTEFRKRVSKEQRTRLKKALFISTANQTEKSKRIVIEKITQELDVISVKLNKKVIIQNFVLLLDKTKEVIPLPFAIENDILQFKADIFENIGVGKHGLRLLIDGKTQPLSTISENLKIKKFISSESGLYFNVNGNLTVDNKTGKVNDYLKFTTQRHYEGLEVVFHNLEDIFFDLESVNLREFVNVFTVQRKNKRSVTYDICGNSIILEKDKIQREVHPNLPFTIEINSKPLNFVERDSETNSNLIFINSSMALFKKSDKFYTRVCDLKRIVSDFSDKDILLYLKTKQNSIYTRFDKKNSHHLKMIDQRIADLVVIKLEEGVATEFKVEYAKNSVSKKLSVVVPMWNVDEYLVPALDSLLKQGIEEKDYEIILIDDGSSDNTINISKNYVKKYPQLFRLIEFENGGLGAARNRGTLLAQGEFIVYFDPDDIVTDNSYKTMLAIIEKSGSDVIVGGVERFNSKRRVASEVHRRVRNNFIAKKIDETPELMWDSTAWNKIYKRSFLLTNNLLFPEGMLFEDLPVVIPAYQLANHIDYYSETMYLWRMREGKTKSITQLRGDKTWFEDRIRGMNLGLQGLRSYQASSRVVNELVYKHLNFDLLLFAKQEKLELLNQDYWEVVFELGKKYLQELSDEELCLARFREQVIYRIWLTQSLDVLKEVIIQYIQELDEIMIDDRSSAYKLTNLPMKKYLPREGVQKYSFDIHSKLQKVIFESATIVLEGYFYGKYLDMSNPNNISAKATIIGTEDKNIAEEVFIRFEEDKEITNQFGSSFYDNHSKPIRFNYDFAHYHVEIPLNIIKKSFNIEIEAEINGIKLQQLIGSPEKNLKQIALYKDLRLYERYHTNTWFLEIEVVPNQITAKWNTGQLAIKDVEEVFLENIETKQRIPLQKDENFTLPTHILGNISKKIHGSWKLIGKPLHANELEREVLLPIYFKNSLGKPISFGQNMLYLTNQEDGGVLEVGYELAIIESIELTPQGLQVEFSLGGWRTLAKEIYIVADPKLPEATFPSKILGNMGSGRIHYISTILYESEHFLKKEWLNIHVSEKFEDGYEEITPLRWGKKNFDLKMGYHYGKQEFWRFHEIKRLNGGLAIHRIPATIGLLPATERNEFLRVDYQKWLKEPLLEDTIMYSSYWGQKFDDNPKAFYEYVVEKYPNMKHIIVLKELIFNDYQFKNAVVVENNSKEYWYYLAKAKYFINNVNFTGEDRVKRSEQVEVQTMHGTPLKTLGFDVLEDWTTKNYYRMYNKNQNWDYITVPSNYVGEYAKKAFLHKAKTLNIGYPRNDQFIKSMSQSVIDELKKELDLPLNKKIVLYAPTWRIKGEQAIKLQLEKFVNSLSEDSFIVVRPHHLMMLTGIDKKYSSKIILGKPERTIQDYFKVSDVLITDYSSAMFDYVLLEKPMIFYTYDYDEYLEERGLLFDFKGYAPGPLVETQEELIQHINASDKINRVYEEKIEKFKHKFVEFDNGNSSENLGKILFDL